MTEYAVIHKDGSETEYVWSQQEHKMVEKTSKEKEIPWWQIHQIADGLKAQTSFKTIVHSSGKRVKQIVIEFTDEED